MIHPVQTEKAPKAVGPYSQAVILGDFVYTSGQIGIDLKTDKVVEGIEKQTNQALENLKMVLEAANSKLGNIVKTTVFLKNISDFAKVNELYEKAFGDHKPARSTVEVSNLPKNALIEIEAIAYRDFEMDSEEEGCACGGNCGCGGHE